MSTTTSNDRALAGKAVERELFGPVMGYVAVTVGFAALGRDLDAGAGLLLFVPALIAIFGLNAAATAGRQLLAIGLLFGLGLLLGLVVAPVVADYADSDRATLWQSAGVTAAFVAALGAYGYATWRGVSSWGRTLFWALLALIVFRNRRDLRLHPRRPPHLRRRRTRHLRRVHDHRLQPPAAGRRPERRLDRRELLPRRLQHLPARARPLQRPARLSQIGA